MEKFSGFREGKTRWVQIPEQFFSEALPKVNDLFELKLVLHVFNFLNQLEGAFRYIIREDLFNDQNLIESFGDTLQEATKQIDNSLNLAVSDHLLLCQQVEFDGVLQNIYFLNTAKGRAAVQAIINNQWRPSGDPFSPIEIAPERPNIFRLYEENIGPLTPIISDSLSDAENTYPSEWIEDAFRIAVENNNRNWRYIAAILDRWQRKGRYERKDRRDSEEARRRYAEWEE